jgi:hypothetical protein
VKHLAESREYLSDYERYGIPDKALDPGDQREEEEG